MRKYWRKYLSPQKLFVYRYINTYNFKFCLERFLEKINFPEVLW